MICQAKPPPATFPPASASRWGRGEGSPQRGQRGCARAASTRLCRSRSAPASAWQTEGASAPLALPYGLAYRPPTISAATDRSAVSVAALAFPSQLPLLPECRTTSRSRVVALGAGKPGLGRQRLSAGRGSPSLITSSWHCT